MKTTARASLEVWLKRFTTFNLVAFVATVLFVAFAGGYLDSPKWGSYLPVWCGIILIPFLFLLTKANYGRSACRCPHCGVALLKFINGGLNSRLSPDFRYCPGCGESIDHEAPNR